jgi:glycosyltransferase involved in cell wall biosynthesis
MAPRESDDPQIALSVIVPVFDQEGVIADNVRIIRERASAGVGEPIEVIVVSDGSIDQTVERVLESRIPDVRVLHYDRNLGKGYAIKTGALEARGRWIGYVDADLDLDPAGLPDFVRAAEKEDLDFVIGSKRHPLSKVSYPRSRVVASWCFQQLVRILFRLDVRDTQVGLKVFRQEVADEVMPLLLVKRYAFDVELLAVSRAFGFGRIKEMPIALDYQFTGSGVRSVAVLHALVDTAAIFYRLRVLRYYQRRRGRGDRSAWERPRRVEADVEVIARTGSESERRAASHAQAQVLAFLEPGSRPSANWLTATTPFLARADVAAVVTPQLAPADGDARQRAAAAISESRVGAGSLHFRFTPGMIRFVSDFPGSSIVVRRDRYLSLPPSTPPEMEVLELAVSGERVMYVPYASVTAPPAPLFKDHLRRISAYGRSRGALVRRRGLSAVRPSTVGVIVLFAWALLGWILAVAGHFELIAWLSLWCVYGVVVVLAAGLGGLRFGSFRVALLTLLGLPLTHGVYGLAFVAGFVSPRAEYAAR